MTDTMVYNILKESITPEEREEARKRMEGKKPVYICLPFTGLNLLKCMKQLNEISDWAEKYGYIVHSPVAIIYQLRNLPIKESFEVAKKASSRLILACEETWFFGNTITDLMGAEIMFAAENGKPVNYLQKCEGDFYLVRGGC